MNCANKKDRFIACVLFIIFVVPATVFTMMVFLEFSWLSLILAIVFDAFEAFLFKLVMKVSKNYFLKYIFNKKKFNKLFNESIKRFSNANKEFLDEYKKYSLDTFNQSGNLFYTPTVEESKWLYSKADERLGLTEIVLLLLNAINDETYFVGFSKNAVKLHDDTYHLLLVIVHSNLPNELKYLLKVVYDKTQFNLEDNGLNEEYTLYINKVMEDVKTNLDPLLIEFKDDINDYLLTLQTNNTITC